MPTENPYTLASEARDYFYRAECAGAPNDHVWYLRPKDTPEWVSSLVYDAHDSGMGPDDWTYRFIAEALEALIEALDDSGSVEDAADYLPEYIYTSDRTAWLASHPFRVARVDEAVSEWEVTEDTDTSDRIALGMAHEQREVLASVMRSIEEHAESLGIE